MEQTPAVRDARADEKKPYSTPELVRHGTVEDLTRGGVVFIDPTDAASDPVK